MSSRPETPGRPDFSIIFSALSDSKHTPVVRASQKIDEQSETIRLIAQATERAEPPRVFTFMTG